MKKKALSSIVAILLLLAMMVSATAVLFNFYKSSNSNLKADLELESDLEKYIDLISIDSNNLYYINSYESSIEFENLSLIDEDCSLSGSLAHGNNFISLGGCTLSNSSGFYTISILGERVFLFESVINKDFYR